MHITHHDIETLPIDRLQRHPHNRPLGVNREKIDQLKESLRQYGYYDSQPIVVRSLPDGVYQIIKGEHRFIAASELGFTELPCSVQEMTDEEALIQLVVGNIQTENHPLEIGLNALQVVQKDSKKGLSAAAYGEKIGINREKTVSEYIRSARVYAEIKQQLPTGWQLLQDVYKLYEISKLPQSEWLWLHDFIVANECSKQQVIAIVKALRELYAKHYPSLIDFPNLEQIAGELFRNGESRTLRDFMKYADKVTDTLSKLDETTTFYEFNVEQNDISERMINLFDLFKEYLAQIDKTVNAVNQAYKKLLQQVRQFAKEQAERDREYFRDERNRQEREELERIEQETRQTIIDLWIEGIQYQDIAAQTNKSEHEIEMVVGEYRVQHNLSFLELGCGDFNTLCWDNSFDEFIDVIITDPPYPKEYLKLYSQLAFVASYVLKPGGSMFVMVGQSYLPELMAKLGEHLTYQWTLAYLTPGGQAVQLWDRNVNTFWKPILWYVKGEYTGKWIGDVAKSDTNDNDKEHHEWGQSVSGMKDIVLRSSEEEDRILDPFCGAGTTGVACRELNRKFIGIDIDSEHIKTARRRIYGM